MTKTDTNGQQSSNLSKTTTIEPLMVFDDVQAIYRHGQIAKFNLKISIAKLDEVWAGEKIRVDHDLQRGEKVTVGRNGEEKRTSMVDRRRVEDMANKIIDGKLHGGALCWNLGREVHHHYDPETRRLSIYGDGFATIPDSVHRHHAARLAAKRVMETGIKVDIEGYEFPLIIELLDDDGERGLFYEYNMLGKHANATRSKWINNVALPNRLTAEFVERSQLRGHVEIVTNNISKNSVKVVTFNVLATAVEAEFPDLDEESIEPIASYLVQFFDAFIHCRPEVGYLPLGRRKEVRDRSIGDSALAFQAYIGVAAALYHHYARHGSQEWRAHVQKLGVIYSHTGADNQVLWEGDLFLRKNPLWHGQVLVEGRNGNLAIINRKETRAFIRDALLKVIGLPKELVTAVHEAASPTTSV